MASPWVMHQLFSVLVCGGIEGAERFYFYWVREQLSIEGTKVEIVHCVDFIIAILCLMLLNCDMIIHSVTL